MNAPYQEFVQVSDSRTGPNRYAAVRSSKCFSPCTARRATFAPSGDNARHTPDAVKAAPPTLAFAVIGQARADNAIAPTEESEWLGKLLTFWALRGTLNMSELCAAQHRSHFNTNTQ